MKKSFGRGIAAGLLLALFVSTIVACSLPENENKLTDITSGVINPATSLDSEAYKTKLSKIMGVLEKYYMDEIDYDKAMEGIYAGMVNSLGDPYTVYFTASEYKNFADSTNGNYAGLGSTVTTNADGNPEFVKPFKGAPAYKAGIVPGDVLCEVDGENVLGMELEAVVAKIKGPAGTQVHVKIYRKSINDYLEMTIVREKVEVPTVEYQMLDNKIGYIAVSSFDQVTEKQFLDAVDDLESKGMKALLVDLRDNPGGMLTTVCGMLSRFVPKGELLVYMETKDGKQTSYNSTSSKTLNVPMAVLINGNSASASEVFCGCMQDYGLATLIGTKSFGKGIVQSLIPLGDGSAVKVTTSKYYSPKGRNIHKVGFEPDILVELSPELAGKASIEIEEDNQIQAAVEYLIGEMK